MAKNLTAPPSTHTNRNGSDNRRAMQAARAIALDTGMNRRKRRGLGKALGIRGTPTADAIRDRQHQKEMQVSRDAQAKKQQQEAEAEAQRMEKLAKEDEAFHAKHGYYPVRHR